MDVLHGGLQALVPQKLLNGSDVRPVLQKVGGEGVTQRVTGGTFFNARRVDRLFHGALHRGVGAVVASGCVAPGILGERRGRKHILPGPFGWRPRILLGEGLGEVYAADPVRTVFLILGLDSMEMVLEGIVQTIGEHRRPVFSSFSIPDEDPPGVEVEILHTKAEGFGEAQAAAIQEVGHEPVFPGSHRCKQSPYFPARQDRGEAPGPIGTLNGTKILKRVVEDRLVEKRQGVERLVLGGGRDSRPGD